MAIKYAGFLCRSIINGFRALTYRHMAGIGVPNNCCRQRHRLYQLRDVFHFGEIKGAHALQCAMADKPLEILYGDLEK